MPKNTSTFLFYDIETSGLNKCFDQVMQFAAIRTDLHFHELERHAFFVQLSIDTLPLPGAILTHRISHKQSTQGITEYDAAQRIHYLVNQPNTISLGYNTLGFDDEFLRFTFFRHLLTPYTHQFANGCMRMDMLPITLLYHLFKPECLKWPNIDGKTSLKLEKISELNHLAEGPAHDAMVDVMATVELAKQLAKDEKMWNYACGYFNKETELHRLDQLNVVHETSNRLFREAILLHTKLGSDHHYMAPVLSLGQHLHYKNQSLWLRLDDDRLRTLTPDTIQSQSFVYHKKCAEQPLLIPTHERFTKKISDERWQQAQENKTWLLKQSSLLEQLCQYHQHYKYPEIDNVDAQASLYQCDFPNNHEKFQMQQFHLADPKQKSKLANHFSNPVYKILAQRMIAKYFQKFSSHEDVDCFENYLQAIRQTDCQQNPRDYVGNRHVNPQDVLQEINRCRQENLNNEQQSLLDELEKQVNA